MTCRHGSKDLDCSKNGGGYNAYVPPTPVVVTPDVSNFELEDIKEIGRHLVLKVKYPNCERCAFEGNKVLVYLDTTVLQAVKWKIIDPHFRGTPPPPGSREAPSPVARFPATQEGWEDAKAYAGRKNDQSVAKDKDKQAAKATEKKVYR